MKGPLKAIILAVAVLVLVGGAFWGGTLFRGSQTQTGDSRPPATRRACAEGRWPT